MALDRMNKPGILTRYALLYEGNLEEWAERMDDLLALHDLQGKNSFILTDAIAREQRLEIEDDTEAEHILAVLRWQTSPDLISRIPAEKFTNLNDFFEALRKCAQPFDFMGLPPELRHNIIRLSVQDRIERSVEIVWVENKDPLLLPRPAAVNHEFSTQVLKLFLEKTTFMLYHRRLRTARNLDMRVSTFEAYGFHFGSAQIMGCVHKWACALRPEIRRLLRHIAIKLPADAARASIKARRSSGTWANAAVSLHYSPKRGVWMEANECLSSKSTSLLQKHLSAINKTAETLGLEGEALIMALTSNPGVCDALEVAFA